MIYNRIPVAFGATKKVTGPAISYQYDVVQKLMIKGLDLPAVYRVDFCNEGDVQTISMTGDADGVPIPDQLLQTGKKIKAYIMLTGTDEGAVETRYEAILPVNSRPAPSDIEPTPAEQQQIDALIEALNDGVERAEDAAEQAEEAAELLTNPSAEATTLEPESPATAEYDDGVFRFGIPKGDKGDKMTYADLTDADKADLVQGPIAEAQTSAVQAVNTAGDTQTDRVNQAGTTNVNAVNQAGTTNLNAVNQAGTTQVGNVNDAGTAQVAAVEAEGTEQVGAVRAKGAEVLESIPDDYTELQHHVDAVTIYETASGAIASFEDGADDLPIKSLVANIEPVQDLHGYDHPWPAGGGVNKLDPAYFSLRASNEYSVSGDNITVLKSDNTAWSSIPVYPLKAGTYTISRTNTSNILAIRTSDDDYSSDVRVLYNANSSGTFTLENDGGIKIKAAYGTSVAYPVTVKLQIESGSTATAYSPYSNICPISGHTGAEVTRTGKNLFNPNVFLTATGWSEADGVYSGSCQNIQFSIIGYLLELPDLTEQVTVSFNGYVDYEDSRAGYFRIHYADGTTSLLEFKDKTWKNYSLTSTSGKTVVGIGFTMSNSRNVSIKDFQVELGSTATAYEPYTGDQISVTFPSEAGTVYGGTLDVTNGVLTVTHGSYTFSGNEVWTKYEPTSGVQTYNSGNRFPPNLNTNGVGIMSRYRFYKTSYIGGQKDKSFCFFSTPIFSIHDDSYSDVTAFAESMAGAVLVYELATPITYQLDPQEIRTLLGANNVWADTGDIAECEYPADTKLYIDGKIADAIAALGT